MTKKPRKRRIKRLPAPIVIENRDPKQLITR
jgi:hypothetical protein